MVVAANKADTAASILDFGITTPHESLLSAETIFAVFIPEVDVADGFFWGGCCCCQGMAAITFLFGREAHVVVKLIVGGDGLA